MRRNVLALDVETVPLAQSLGAEPTEAAIKTASLSPRLGRVLAIGYAARGGDGPVEATRAVGYAATEADERDVLLALTRRLRHVALTGGVVVTFSGKTFDVPFLAVRCAAHGIEMSFARLLKRWSDDAHFDVRHVVCGGERKAGETLDAWCKAFGLGGKGEMTGADVYPAWLAGRHEQIKLYVQNDASDALALYDRLSPVFL